MDRRAGERLCVMRNCRIGEKATCLYRPSSPPPRLPTLVSYPHVLVLVTCHRSRSRSEAFHSLKVCLKQDMGRLPFFWRKVHHFRTSVERSAQHWPMLLFLCTFLSLSSGAIFLLCRCGDSPVYVADAAFAITYEYVGFVFDLPYVSFVEN